MTESQNPPNAHSVKIKVYNMEKLCTCFYMAATVTCSNWIRHSQETCSEMCACVCVCVCVCGRVGVWACEGKNVMNCKGKVKVER